MRRLFPFSITGTASCPDNRTIGLIPGPRPCIRVKALLAGVLLAGLIVLGSGTGFASAVSFDLSYTDPASDVVEFWTSNMTPVLTDGNLTMSPFPDSVNMLHLTSSNASADVVLTMQVKGTIANLDNTSYQIRLYTRQDNATHFAVTHVNRTTTLASNATGFVPIDLSGSTTIVQDTLSVRVAKSRLGTITAWEIDATASETEAVYTYVDYGWRIPGNPGSAPRLPGAQFILPNAAWIALVPVVIAIAIVVVIVLKDRADRSSTKSSKAKAEPVSFQRRGKP